MKNLYKFYWDCRRAGQIDGIFIATQEDVDNLLGKEVSFGEVLGKHSEVYGTVDKGDIRKLNVSQQTVDDLFKSVGATISGYNPLNYYYEDEEENDE